MKTRISVQERLKDLRVERGLNLEELAQETGISKSALGSYGTSFSMIYARRTKMTAKVRRIPRLPMNLYGKYKRPCNLRGTGFSNSRRYSARRSGSNTSGSHKRNEAF